MEALARLDRRDQVAQLIVVGVALTDPSPADEFVPRGVGGLFLQGPSSILANELAALADDMNMSLRSAGINLNLAPVVDVVPEGTEDANAPIGARDRQYGSTAQAVSAAAGTVADGLFVHRVTPTLKHFPGLGRVRENPDKSRDTTDDVTTRDDDQVAAFGTLAGSDAEPFVMMSSATYTPIAPTVPAVFSPVVVGDLLREQLGFEGVVTSDDVGATQAVQGVPVDERAVRYLEVGAPSCSPWTPT